MKAVKIIVGIMIGLFLIGAAFGSIGLKEIRQLSIMPVDLSTVADGTYKGSFDKYRWHYATAVTVKDHRIVSVSTTNTLDAPRKKISEAIGEMIVSKQSITIDAVSGASVETKAFCKSVENALQPGSFKGGTK